MADPIVEVIKDGQIISMAESEAKREGLFILRRPTLTDSPKAELSKPMQNVRRDRPSYSLGVDYKRNHIQNDLIEHFSWELIRLRRLKNLTRKQLANLVNTSEESIKLLEKGELPADNYILINKLEEVFNVKLRKNVPAEPKIARVAEPKPVSETTLRDLQDRKKNEKVDKSFLDKDIELIE